MLYFSLLTKQWFFKAEEDTNRKETTDTGKSNEDQKVDNTDETIIRQRISANTSNSNEEEEPMVTDIILEASIQRSNK